MNFIKMMIAAAGVLVGGAAQAVTPSVVPLGSAVYETCSPVQATTGQYESVCFGKVAGSDGDYVFVFPSHGNVKAFLITESGPVPTFVALPPGEALLGLALRMVGEVGTDGRVNAVPTFQPLVAHGTKHTIQTAVASLSLYLNESEDLYAKDFSNP